MLDQLVESKSNTGEKNSRTKFLFSTTLLVALCASSAILWSLFAKDIVSANDSLEISNLVAPVPVAASEPDKPEPVKKMAADRPAENQPKEITRQTNTLRVDESPIAPSKVSAVPTAQKARPANTRFTINNGPESDGAAPAGSDRGSRGGDDINRPGRDVKKPREEDIDEKPPALPPVKKPEIIEKKPEPPKKLPIQSLGVVNGKATDLPKPAYSAAAKAVGAAGKVTVQVMIDEKGNVVSANAVDGHPLLRNDAVNAARKAKFSPTYLSNQPVKVQGVVIYNFVR